MEITITVPDELISGFGGDPGTVGRIALEALAVEGYRSGRLSAFEVRQMLGHDSRWETEEFLSAHGVWPGTTVEDVLEDMETLKSLQIARP